jgi:hypothetical protein
MISAQTKRGFRHIPRLGILTAAWGRSTLTNAVQEYYAILSQTIASAEIVPMMVWSPEDQDPPAPHPAWNYETAPNSPLGKKWNAGLAALMDMGVDAVMIIGSDDLVSHPYVEACLEQLKNGKDIISVRELFIYQPGQDHVAYCQNMVPGAGRCVTRRIVEQAKGKLWDDDIDEYLDSSITHRLRQVDGRRNSLRPKPNQRQVVLDVKVSGGPCMWRFEENGAYHALVNDKNGTLLHVRRVVLLPADQFFRDHFPQITNHRALGTGNPYVETPANSPDQRP